MNKISYNPLKHFYWTLQNYGTKQNQQILNYLQSGFTLTQKQARRKFNVERLASRIVDLKDKGHSIGVIYHKLPSGSGKSAEYYLNK